jgi:hypothetical protein
VSGSAGVMALVLAETVAGAAALLWFTPLWNEVKRGFFKLTGGILLVLAFCTWWSARAGMIVGDEAGTWAVRLALITAATIGVGVLLLFLRQDLAGRVIGIASVPVAVAVLAAMALTGRQAWALGFFQLLAGAFFLGSVTDGLLLGHWYLTDRGLSRGPINRYTNLMLVAVVVEAIAVISGGFQGTGASQAVNPLLTAGALAPWIALGMTATTALIAGLTRAALKGERASAVQSATGFYYLAVVTAFTAELAVKTRFLAG